MIISRYLIKEVLTTLLAVTFVLMLIFLSNQLVRLLSYAASGKIAAHLVLQLIGLEVPYLLALLLPLGLYLGIMLAYGRLYADNEMRVLHACGFSIGRLTRVTGTLAIVIALIVLVLSLWFNPFIASFRAKAFMQNGTSNLLDTLIPGRFQVINDGKRVVYVEKIARNRKQANNLFIADQGKDAWRILSADQGYQVIDRINHERFLVATNGYRYEGVPGQNNYKVIEFKKYTVRTPQAITQNEHQIEEAIPTQKLLATYDNPQNAAEFQWRVSIAISAFILALLAIPLSQIKPRQSRYSMLFVAILIYVIYINLLFVARHLVKEKIVSVTIGMWWVHLLILAALGVVFLVQSGWKIRRS